MEKFRSICVYCGSSTGRGSTFTKAAIELAEYLVAEGCRLVNGGGSIGLMGVMTNRILELGGEAIGVIPMSLKVREVAHLGMTELIVVPDMHSRKLTMVNLSDAFICLPGGFGTLDELFETLTWSQLYLHRKPIGILNVDGFFDPLLQMLSRMVQENFLKAEARALLHTHEEIPALFEKLYSPSKYNSQKWDTEPAD
ncbi:MAG TPA: TIGR00730 family Rossman fold protein [Saprospiraceae bacterium]|nr:TIGR00730 family Rossman fold protein [Saprospiraceae bacterium]